MADQSQGIPQDPSLNPSLFGGSFVNPAYATAPQRQMLYNLSNQLLQPQPIKNGWQGLASMANALLGGIYSGQADRMEQASQVQDKSDYARVAAGILTPPAPTVVAPAPAMSPVSSSAPGGAPMVASASLMPPAPPSGTARADKTPDPADYPTTQAGQAAFLRDYAPFAGGKGIDPNFALGVGGAEGLNAISPQNPSGASTIDIDPQTGKPFSFGALQLNVRNGLGTEARAAGIDPADPTQANNANKFALDYMAQHGLAPWKGDKAVEAYRATLAAPPVARAYAPAAPMTSAPAATAINAATSPNGAQSPAIAALASALTGNGSAPPADDPRLAMAAALTGRMPPPVPATGVDRLSPVAAASPLAAPAIPSAAAPAMATPLNPPPPPVRPPGLGAVPSAPATSMPPAPSPAPPSAVAPPGPLPIAPPPPPAAPVQNAPPVSAADIGEFLGNRNIDPETKRAVLAMLAPKAMTDVLGNTSVSYQNQAPQGGPIFRAGAMGPVIGGAVPSVVSGTLQNPVNMIAAPQVPGITPPTGGRSGSPAMSPAPNIGAAILGPNSAAGSIIGQQQTNEANAQLMKDQTDQNNKRYQSAIDTYPQLQNSAYPLHQLQAVLEKNGGALPSGEGADKIVSTGSLVNSIATMLGHPLTDEDSKLTQMELLRKYGAQVQMSLMGRNTDMGAHDAEKVSPGIGPTQAANIHLVDNYLRLNDLAQKKAQFEQNYVQSKIASGVPMAHIYDHFNNDWTKEITDNPVPLSRFGRQVKLRSGQPGVYVPSTDPSGFSLFPANAPEFQPSVMTPTK